MHSQYTFPFVSYLKEHLEDICYTVVFSTNTSKFKLCPFQEDIRKRISLSPTFLFFLSNRKLANTVFFFISLWFTNIQPDNKNYMHITLHILNLKWNEISGNFLSHGSRLTLTDTCMLTLAVSALETTKTQSPSLWRMISCYFETS